MQRYDSRKSDSSALLGVNIPASDIATIARAIGDILSSIFNYAAECERTRQLEAQFEVERGKIAFAREELKAKAIAFKKILASGELRSKQIVEQICPIKDILLDYHRIMMNHQDRYDPGIFERLCQNYHKTLESYTTLVELLHFKNNFSLAEVQEISNELPEIVQ